MINKLKFFLEHYSRYPRYIARTLFDFRKSVNSLKYFLSVNKKEDIGYVPPIFVASTSMACNLRCPSCQYILKNRNVFQGGGFVKLDDFKSTIEKYAPNIIMVGLTGGEPLLHPELDQIVRIIKDNKLFVSISTNGILVKKKIDTLKLLDSVSVSMDGCNYEDFRRFRGGTERQFDEILEGISLLKKHNIDFRISFTLTEENIDKVYEIITFGRKTKPNVIEFHNINPHGSKDYKSLTKNNKKVAQILNDITSKNDYPFDILIPVIFDTESEHFKTARCNQPWRYCYFDNKGNIAPCCHLRHSEEFGNIFKDYNFNSEKIKNFRQLMIKGSYPNDCIWCTKRFAGEEYGLFNTKTKKWILRN